MTRSPARSDALLLVTGPAGSGKTHVALTRVREAATRPGGRGRESARAGEALLVLPTYAQAMHLRRVALSRWGARAVLDDPFTTFTAAGERFLPGFRVRALPSPEERDRLMEEALARVPAPAFRAVADRPGFRARLLRLLKEVKQSGLSPAEGRDRLRRAGERLTETARERLDGVVAVFEVYERLLARAGLEDHEDTLRRLRDRLRADPPARRPRLLAVDGFDDLTPVEAGILDALADLVRDAGGEVLVTLPWDERRPHLFASSAVARARLLARGFAERRLEGFPRSPQGALARIARDLFGTPSVHPEPVPGGLEVRLVVAADPEDEAEAVARQARALAREERDGRPLLRGWRDLGVVLRRCEEAAPRFRAAFERLGVPLRVVGEGTPLAGEALVRTLGPVLRLLGGATRAGRFDALPLLAWVRWVAHARDEDDLMAAADRQEIRWRREGLPWDWAAFRAGADPRLGPVLEEVETRRRRLAEAEGASSVYAALREALADLAPLPPAGGLLADGRPADPGADARRRAATAALRRVEAAIESLATAASRTGLGAALDAEGAAGEVEVALERARFVLPDRRLDAVSLLDAEEARFWDLPVVIVAGLSEGAFPLRPREDVLLRDAEREALREADDALALPLARDREVRERRLFYGAVTRAHETLVLVRAASDAEGDPRPASFFLADLARVVTPSPSGPPRPLGRVAPAAEECHTTRDWALYAAARLGGRRRREADVDLAAALLREGASDVLGRAARYRRARADDLLPAVDAARRRALFGASVRVVSATDLNAAVACLHRHFLRRVLAIPEDDAPFEGPRFGPRETGTLLHAALRIALEEGDLSPAAVADRAVEEVGGLPRRPLDRDLVRDDLARAVALFRDREEARTDPLRPLAGGLERAFGHDGRLVLESPAGSFALRGRVDRVDVAQGDAVVIDYKRSSTGVERAWRAANEGRDLQLPLYAAALERLLGLRVVGVEWVAAAARRRRLRWSERRGEWLAGRSEGNPPLVEAEEAFRGWIGAALERSARTVRAVCEGDHAKQRDDAETCAACAYRGVCRPAPPSPGPGGTR